MTRAALARSAVVASLLAAACHSRSSATDVGDGAPLAAIGDPFVAAEGGALVRGAAAGPGDAGEGAAAPQAPVIKATVRLLEPGEAPRRKLRYAWRRLRKETLTIDLRTTAGTESEGERPPDVALPAVRIVVATDPRDVSSAGDLSYDWHVTSTKVMPAPGSNPQLGDSMLAEVGVIGHLAGTTVVSSSGLATSVVVDPSSIADVHDAGATGEMVEQVRQTLTDLETPLPDEEVGKGARWEKVAKLAAKSAVVRQTDTFTLTSSSGDHAAVDDVLAQTAPPQDFPAVAKGAKGAPAQGPSRLESMLATGTSKSRFELDRIVPFTTYSGTTTMIVSGPGEGNGPRRVTMTLRVDIALSGSSP